MSRIHAIILILLLSATAVVYHPIKNYTFLNFDDNLYVTNNPQVKKGLNWETIKWAFHPAESSEHGYWQPINWLAHTTTVQLFGLHAGFHHLVNLFLHLLNVSLLFLLLHYMTGSPGRSLFAAALFALHPINVDSVAWISELKNLLSTAFGLIAMLAYVYYAKRPSFLRYCWLVIPFAISLMTKSMLVTLPCILLLLDYWPLNRINGLQRQTFLKNDDVNHMEVPLGFQKIPIFRLIIEKLPLLAMSMAAIAFSVFSLNSQARVVDTAVVPVSLRIFNAVVSYFVYLKKMLWPYDLAIFYPYPKAFPLWQPITAACIVMLLSGAILWRAKKSPYLLTGWLWYLGTLVPVSGLMQGGLWPALADRWAYVPLIGIFIVIAWGLPELWQRFQLKNYILQTGAVVLLLLLSIQTSEQVTYWKNDYTLFDHALAVTENNHVAHCYFGIYHGSAENPEKARYHFKKSIEIEPRFVDASRNFADFLADQGDYEAARFYYNKALFIDPLDIKMYTGLGKLYLETNQHEKAERYFSKAIRIAPNNAEQYNAIGNAYLKNGKIDRAIKNYKQAIHIESKNPVYYYNLGLAMTKLGKPDEALTYYTSTIKHDPEYLQAHLKLAEIFFHKNRYSRALDHYDAALKIKPDDETVHFSKGVVLLRLNRMEKAEAQFRKALAINPNYTKASKALHILGANS